MFLEKFPYRVKFYTKGGGIGHTFGVRVQKVQRVRPAFGRLVQRVADCLSGNAYKVSVTGLAFYIIWHEKHYVDQPPPVAFPPLVPYGTTFPPLSGGTIKL